MSSNDSREPGESYTKTFKERGLKGETEVSRSYMRAARHSVHDYLDAQEKFSVYPLFGPEKRGFSLAPYSDAKVFVEMVIGGHSRKSMVYAKHAGGFALWKD